MQKNAYIKDILLKEASERIYTTKELDIKNALLNDAIMHIASIDKSGMGAQRGSSYYRLSKNVEVKEFPYEDHPKIQKIKQGISTDFVPLLIQRIKEQGGKGKKGKWVKIDLKEVLKGTDPFYIRMLIDKHIFPSEGREQIENELAQLAPNYKEVIDLIEQVDLAPVPFYNLEETNYTEPLTQLSQRMLASLAAPVSPNTGQWNYLTAQPSLKKYWERMHYEITNSKKSPPLFRTLPRDKYEKALSWPLEQIDEIPDIKTLLQGIYFAETNESNSLYSASPQDRKEKKAQWEAFVFSQMLPSAEQAITEDENKAQILARQKAQIVADRVWKLYGEVPPEKRDLKESASGRGKIRPPYDQFHQNDIRMLLKFLKVPQIRFTACPRLHANGLDMPHIYPPVHFNKASEKYDLDYNTGNGGFLQMKLDLGAFLELSKDENAKKVNDLYTQLMAQKDHPIMTSHTGADNFLFMLQNLSNMQMETSVLNSDTENKIKAQYGPNANAIINFMKGLLGSRKATPIKDTAVLKYGPQLYTAMTKPTENGVPLGYQIAKILDVLQYTIIKNLDDPIYKVRGRNYSTGGIKGEIMLALEYAYGVIANQDIAGGKQENIRALEQAPRPMSGVSPEMVRKTHHYQQFEGNELQQMDKKPVYVEQGEAKLAPYVSYIVTHKTGAIHSRSVEGQNFDTLERALSHLEKLYPQSGSDEAMSQQLYLISLRMDIATKEIRSIIEEAIKLKQAEIDAALGMHLVSETGQNMDESLADLGKEVSSIKEEVQEYDPNYVVDDGGFLQPGENLGSTQGAIAELGQGVPQAEKIVVQLLSTDNWEIVEFLQKTKIKGNELVAHYAHFGNNNLQKFVEVMKKAIESHKKEEAIFGKKPIAPEPAPTVTPNAPVVPNVPEISEEPEKNAEDNRISKLIKLADKFDTSGYTHIANKIDLLLAKIKD